VTGKPSVQGANPLEGSLPLRTPPRKIHPPDNYGPLVKEPQLPVSARHRQRGKPFAFALAHGEGGASIWWGVLITSITTASFKRLTISGTKVNGLALQPEIQNIAVHEAASLDTDKLKQTHLGWYGDVYAQWDCDEEGTVTNFDITGPSTPSGQNISELTEELSRDTVSGTYYIKIGTVDNGSPVDQIVSSDIYWSPVIFRGNTESSPSDESNPSSGSSGSSANSSQGSSKDSGIVPSEISRLGFLKWFAMEAADVRFEDTFTDLKVRGKTSTFRIDPRVIEGVHVETLRVVGWSADTHHTVGFTVKPPLLHIHANPDKRRRPTTVQVRISAIRKGFLGVKLTEATRAEFDANERRLNLGNH
jgi:hypothetical protein